MIFRSGVFSRKQDLNASQFAAHWTHVHGRLAAKLPGLHQYLQNHIDARLYERESFPSHGIDGISQLWFDDVAAMERAESSSEYGECKKDIPNFQGEITILVLEGQLAGECAPATDPSRTHGTLEGSAKLLWLATSKSSRSPAELAEMWMDETGGASAMTVPGASRLVQDVVVDRAHPVEAGVPQGRMPADVLREVWFRDVESLHAWFHSSAGRSAIFEHRQLEPLAIYLCHEVRIV